MNKKILMATIFFISLFVISSGCTDLYNALQKYVPTPTPGPSTHVQIGQNLPASSASGVTITGSGNTIIIRGRGAYNLNTHQDLFTLNEGNADITIHLTGQGFGCAIALDNINSVSGNTFIIPLLSFADENRIYDLSKQYYMPYTGQYHLSVNWGGDWEVTIAQ